MKYEKTIIISAVNLVEGGGLSILQKCAQEISIFNLKNSNTYKVIILIHDKALLPKYENVIYIEYPLAKKNWFFRVFYEYIFFYFVSKQYKPLIWFSLHDITPNVKAKYLYTYMHNPSPFSLSAYG